MVLLRNSGHFLGLRWATRLHTSLGAHGLGLQDVQLGDLGSGSSGLRADGGIAAYTWTHQAGMHGQR